MSRRSAAALSVVPATPSTPDTLLPAPDGFSEAEAALWREIISTKPAEWFGEDSAPVLKEYVRAAVMCDLLSDRINEALASGSTADVKMLLELRDREARRAANLATKLRLTQQSRYTPQASGTANNRANGKRPWQG